MRWELSLQLETAEVDTPVCDVFTDVILRVKRSL